MSHVPSAPGTWWTTTEAGSHTSDTNEWIGACLVSGYFGDQGQIKTASCCILNHQAISHSISGSFFFVFLSSLQGMCVQLCAGVVKARQYGDSYLVLKDVRLRCTMCSTDSGGWEQKMHRLLQERMDHGFFPLHSLKINSSWFFLVFFLIQYSSLCCIY